MSKLSAPSCTRANLTWFDVGRRPLEKVWPAIPRLPRADEAGHCLRNCIAETQERELSIGDVLTYVCVSQYKCSAWIYLRRIVRFSCHDYLNVRLARRHQRLAKTARAGTHHESINARSIDSNCSSATF